MGKDNSYQSFDEDIPGIDHQETKEKDSNLNGQNISESETDKVIDPVVVEKKKGRKTKEYNKAMALQRDLFREIGEKLSHFLPTYVSVLYGCSYEEALSILVKAMPEIEYHITHAHNVLVNRHNLKHNSIDKESFKKLVGG
ncbi:MAG: hypothetical protein MUC49_21235 [Raineya sp.]|jgi:hypothetical protein|nr:hypothetical protein [Raineya sp.]